MKGEFAEFMKDAGYTFAYHKINKQGVNVVVYYRNKPEITDSFYGWPMQSVRIAHREDNNIYRIEADFGLTDRHDNKDYDVLFEGECPDLGTLQTVMVLTHLKIVPDNE